MRLSAGYSTTEVATLIEAERDELEHLDPPKRRPVDVGWVQARLRDLRDELREVS